MYTMTYRTNENMFKRHKRICASPIKRLEQRQKDDIYTLRCTFRNKISICEQGPRITYGNNSVIRDFQLHGAENKAFRGLAGSCRLTRPTHTSLLIPSRRMKRPRQYHFGQLITSHAHPKSVSSFCCLATPRRTYSLMSMSTSSPGLR